MKILDRIRGAAFIYNPKTKQHESVFDDAMIVTRHQDRGVKLMQEALLLPFTDSKAEWDKWCSQWAARAADWIREAQE